MTPTWQSDYYRYKRYFFSLPELTKNQKFQSFFWLSFTFTTITFFCLVAIKPTVTTIAKLNREIKDKTEAVALLDTKIRNIVIAQQEYAKYSDRIGLLDQALPKGNNFPNIAIELEQMAAANGVNLNLLSFERLNITDKGKSTRGDIYSTLFTLSVSGSYQSLKSFLEAMQGSVRLYNINSSRFSKVIKKDGLAEISLNVTGQTYYLTNTKGK